MLRRQPRSTLFPSAPLFRSSEPVAIVSIFTGLCLIDWQLTLGMLVLFPVCIIPIIYFGKKARDATGKRVAANIDQSSLAMEMFSGMRVIKAFGLETARVDRFRELSQQLIRQTMKTVRSREIVGPLVETVSMIGIGALILYVVHTSRSIPDLVVFFTGVIMFRSEEHTSELQSQASLVCRLLLA